MALAREQAERLQVVVHAAAIALAVAFRRHGGRKGEFWLDTSFAPDIPNFTTRGALA